MIKLTITKLGTPKTIITKHGPKEKNWLQATEYGAQYLNYWINGTSKGWQEGQIIEVEAVEERKYIGKDGTEKTSLEIRLPKSDSALAARVEKLEAELKATQNFIKEAVVVGLKDHNRRIKALEPVSENAEKVLVGDELLDYPERDDEVAF